MAPPADLWKDPLGLCIEVLKLQSKYTNDRATLDQHANPSDPELQPQPPKRRAQPGHVSGVTFLDLPAELRLEIYKYHFSNISNIKPRTAQNIDAYEPELDNIKDLKALTGLLCASSQIMQETLPTFQKLLTARIGPLATAIMFVKHKMAKERRGEGLNSAAKKYGARYTAPTIAHQTLEKWLATWASLGQKVMDNGV